MKIKHLLPGGLLFFVLTLQAQEKKQLSLDEAISLAVTKSTEANLADTKVATSKLDLDNTKNNQYPDFKVSGQYMRITNPTVKLRIPLSTSEPAEGETATASPKVNQIMFGQASFSMPLFSGFKLRNSVDASENIYRAQTFNAVNTKEQLAMQTVVLYVNLYKAQESVKLIQENLKSANQRVADFTAMEKNGLLARNDFLKATLQASNIQLTLDDAIKNVSTINFQLVTLLKLPAGTQLSPSDSYFKKSNGTTPSASESEAIASRSDLEAMRFEQKASESNVKIAKGDYYPAISVSAGYVALDIQNVAQVYNAVNFGVGFSYDIANIFKNSKKVKAAQSRAEETRQQLEIMTDQVKVQVNEAQENYNLSIKQDKVYAEAVEQATENYRIVKDKYDNGLVDTNDLLEADVEQLQAKINGAFSKADITQRYYELLNASGKLTNSFNLTPNKN
ncbi:TolC family protein [Flavobacterium sp. DG1-102-2]|uniref:TolC family protein n=1 Tax=Flavobacterium sp. DG1-102-2 TaxID=3081663 RepID=UPI0029492803|nr:TolC family protein [Flavobacterium sp. DG1-102-2]MDV6168714.1 TolC family protein [Flavobacterium sp. DG1-102-2]